MKLRFQGNTLRLRLSQPEVERLGESGLVEEKVMIAPGQILSYSLQISPAGEVAASFVGGHLSIELPRALATTWIASGKTGIDASSGSLRMLIEKDFKCLHRDGPEDAGAFPNPLASEILTKQNE
jgi:hypothetical protein